MARQPRDILAIGGLLACLLADYFFPPLYEDLVVGTALVIFFVYIIFSDYVERHDARNKDSRPLGPFAFRFSLVVVLCAIVLFANGALDYSVPVERRSVVIQRWVAHGKGGSTSYHLKIEALDPTKSDVSITVPGYIYGQARDDSPITMELHRGVFSIPWIGTIRFDQVGR
jgi:hypothetical protein